MGRGTILVRKILGNINIEEKSSKFGGRFTTK